MKTTDTVISTVKPEDKAKTPAEREWILRQLDYSAFLATFSFEESESI